jgi:hypothetical protein
MNYKLSYQDASTGDIILHPYYYDGQQIVEGNAPSWTSDIYYFGTDVVRRDYGTATPWLTVVVSSGNSFWTPWTIPSGYSEMPPPPPPPPPINNDPCINIVDFGIELRNETFVTVEEASKYLSKSEVDRLSSLEKYSTAALLDSKNVSGSLYNFKCTNYYIDNVACWIQQVSYDMVPEFNLFIAKYYFPNGIPTTLNGNLYYDTKFRSSDGYYYVTEGGRICYIERVIESSPPPIILPPKPDIIKPDTPLIGAGSVYSSEIESVYDYEIVTKTIWPDNKVHLNSGYSHCDGSFGSPVDKDLLSFGFDVYSHPYNYPEKECVKKLFRVAYGDSNGHMIPSVNGKSMTKAVYSQYAQKLLGDPHSMFIMGGNSIERILIIDFSVDLFGYELDPGNWQLGLIDSDVDTVMSNNFNIADFVTASNVADQTFIDTAHGLQIGDTDYSYDIVTGSLAAGITSEIIKGKFYPKHGVMVFIYDEVRTWTQNDTDDFNFHPWKFYRLLEVTERSPDPTGNDPYPFFTMEGFEKGMIVRSRIKNYTRNYFLRVKHYNFNLSNNPTYIDEQSNLVDFMQGDPKTYITSVGLYNNKKELLAVGKFPKPIKKDFSEEMVVSVKLIQ